LFYIVLSLPLLTYKFFFSLFACFRSVDAQSYIDDSALVVLLCGRLMLSPGVYAFNCDSAIVGVNRHDMTFCAFVLTGQYAN
jgi:hypothetical protein